MMVLGQRRTHESRKSEEAREGVRVSERSWTWLVYVEMNRPDRLLRNHDGTTLKMQATRNQNVFKSPYYRGVQLWERLPNVTRTLHEKKEFKHNLKGIEL